MENKDVSLRQWKENFEAGRYSSPDVPTQIFAGWYDWFCKESSLANKTRALGLKFLSIYDSPKLDKENHYIFFKNNCPLYGKLYDSFSICDRKTGDVIFWVTPSSGFDHKKGKAEVYGPINGFKEPLAEGTWTDIKKFFLPEEDRITKAGQRLKELLRKYEIYGDEVKYISQFITNWEVFDFENLKRIVTEMENLQKEINQLSPKHERTLSEKN